MFDFNMITKIIELGLTVFGLSFAIFGWILPYKQSKKSENNQRSFEKKLLCAKWEKELLDKQISLFYGPVAELLREQALISKLIWNQIGRRTIFQENESKLSDLSENEQKIWTHFIDTYSIPIHKKIVKIIQKNQHLIYKSQMPRCFKPYMEYVLGWELLDNQKRNNVPNHYEYYYSFNYPKEFNYYIENTLAILLEKQNSLLTLN